jgi:phasin
MTTSPKSAKAPKAAAAAATPFDAFNMSMPTVEVPAAFREFAEQGIAQVRDVYAKIKSVAEDATGLVEGTYETAREGAFAIGVKALDAAKENSDASFAFYRNLFGAKTFADVIELQTAFARTQFDAVSAQFKDLQELGQKFVAETTKPVASQVEKSFKEFRVS